MWNIHAGRVTSHLTDPALPTSTAHAQNSTLTCLTVSADRKCLVSGATDGVLKVWELTDDDQLGGGGGGGGGGIGGGAIVHLNGHEDEVGGGDFIIIIGIVYSCFKNSHQFRETHGLGIR